MVLNVVVELFVRDPRLDERETEIRIDFKNTVHPFQVEHHLASFCRRGRAVSEIAAGRDRPNRHFVLIANSHDLLNLLNRRRQERSGRGMVRIGDRHHGLDIGGQLLRRHEHRVLT